MFHIGILQLTQNLDDAVRGFKEGLKEFAVEAEFHYLNADGNVDILPKLAQQLADLNVDLIFACSTPSAIAARDLQNDIPVVFTPVFDPVGAKLVDNMQTPGGKVTGVSGMVNATDKVNFIKTLLPTAKKLGILYHTADSNAIIEVNNFRKAAATAFELTEISINHQNEISLLSEKLPQNLDALFLPIGKIIEENFSSIAYYTDALDIPIITSHAPNVVLGALGALVANHRTLAKDCAVQAKEILVDGKSPKTIPIGLPKSPEILLNAFVADNLGFELPKAVVEKATEIYN